MFGFGVAQEKKSLFMNELAGCLNKLRTKSSIDTRMEMAEKVCRQFDDGIFSEIETKIVSEILEVLSKDIEVSVRKVIAENLKTCTKLPRNIALGLARDITEVALPILEFSFVLSDEDLIEIIKSTKEVIRHQAIAKRSSVSYPVSEELINTKNEEAITTLVKNKNAFISNRSVEKIINDFKSSDNILEPLINRGGLSLTLVEQMISTVSDRLREQIVMKYSVSPKILDSITESASETMILATASYDGKKEQIDKLVDSINDKNKLNFSIVMRALCKGDLDFFTASLAKLANIPTANAQKLVQDNNLLGFTAIYKAAGLPENLFEAAKIILRFVLETKQAGFKQDEFARRISTRIVTEGYDKSIVNMKYFMMLMNNSSPGQKDTTH